jgi:membrane associated rhomboid family serine protease
MPRVTDERLPDCYRHPGRETALSCSNCGRPICPECMTPTPVGQRCPECVGRTRVVRPRAVTGEPRVTYALIAANVVVFLALGGLGSFAGNPTSSQFYRFALYGPAVANGDWWRMVTSMFLHANLLHIGFNMYALYIFGPPLEQRFGGLRFAALYFVAGLWGSAGALLLSPNVPTVGASGAIFGLMGGLVVVLRRHGARNMSGVGAIIFINLLLTFSISGISIGGHIGGLIGGILTAAVLEFGGVYRERLGWMVAAGVIALAAAAVAFGVAVA